MASTQARLLFFDNSVANASLLVNETTLKQLLLLLNVFSYCVLRFTFHKNDTQVLDGAHANTIVFDKQTNEIFVFEPHGGYMRANNSIFNFDGERV